MIVQPRLTSHEIRCQLYLEETPDGIRSLITHIIHKSDVILCYNESKEMWEKRMVVDLVRYCNFKTIDITGSLCGLHEKQIWYECEHPVLNALQVYAQSNGFACLTPAMYLQNLFGKRRT